MSQRIFYANQHTLEIYNWKCVVFKTTVCVAKISSKFFSISLLSMKMFNDQIGIFARLLFAFAFLGLLHLSPELVTYYIIDRSHHKKLNYISNGVFTSARARLCLHVQTSANARLNAGVNGHVNQLLRYVKICILRCIHTDRDTDLPQKVTVEVLFSVSVSVDTE